jgi:hypothetical protein
MYHARKADPIRCQDQLAAREPQGAVSIVHGVPSLVRGSGFLRVFSTQSEQPAGKKVKRADVPDHATSEIASGSKLGIDATKKWPGEGFKRPAH